MKISIITVCYNSDKTISDCIDSVLSQTYKDIEFIIIDGGSTDNTLNILKSYSYGISNIISEPDNGIYDAMNKGISIATGHIIGFLNSDDTYSSNNILSTINSVFNQHTNLDVCYGDICYVSRTNPNKKVRYWHSTVFKRGNF